MRSQSAVPYLAYLFFYHNAFSFAMVTHGLHGTLYNDCGRWNQTESTLWGDAREDVKRFGVVSQSLDANDVLCAGYTIGCSGIHEYSTKQLVTVSPEQCLQCMQPSLKPHTVISLSLVTHCNGLGDFGMELITDWPSVLWHC